jgi:hypothetical protein
LRRSLIVGRRHRREIESAARGALLPRRIDQAVAAHPNLIIRARQIGNEITALIIRHHHAGELGRQVGGFRNHPDAGFRPARAADDATDISVADSDGGG